MKTDFYTKVLLTIIVFLLACLTGDKVYDAAVPESTATTPTWVCGSFHKNFVEKIAEEANKQGLKEMVLTAAGGAQDSPQYVNFCGKK